MGISRQQVINLPAGVRPGLWSGQRVPPLAQLPARGPPAVVRPNFDAQYTDAQYTSAWLDLTNGPVLRLHAPNTVIGTTCSRSCNI